MEKIYSQSGEFLFGLAKDGADVLFHPRQLPFYTVTFIASGEGKFHADFGIFNFSAPVLLFSTPLQLITIDAHEPIYVVQLQFHGDFYCIEYHRREVSCNGLLFNNVYVNPIVVLNEEQASSFSSLLDEISVETRKKNPSDIVLRAYLQLFLAKSSSIKLESVKEQGNFIKDEAMERFRQLLDEHYLTLHRPSDYAQLLAMSPNNFTRRCSAYFKKNPSNLIQERLILEAKKQLHLTRQSIKEIAYNLKFQDEFYFSRFFKKFVKVSPQAFRQKTGISIVADLPK